MTTIKLTDTSLIQLVKTPVSYGLSIEDNANKTKANYSLP